MGKKVMTSLKRKIHRTNRKRMVHKTKRKRTRLAMKKSRIMRTEIFKNRPTIPMKRRQTVRHRTKIMRKTKTTSLITKAVTMMDARMTKPLDGEKRIEDVRGWHRDHPRR